MDFINILRELFKFSKTKLLGYLVFFAGTYAGLKVNGDTNTMLQSWYLAALLVGGKTITNSIREIKQGGK